MNEALKKAQEAMAAKRAAGEKIVVLDPIQKAKANPTSLRMAINAKCWDCVGAGCDPAPRRAIGQCPSTDCPLWNVRPYQKYMDELRDAHSSQEAAETEKQNPGASETEFEDII